MTSTCLVYKLELNIVVGFEAAAMFLRWKITGDGSKLGELTCEEKLVLCCCACLQVWSTHRYEPQRPHRMMQLFTRCHLFAKG